MRRWMPLSLIILGLLLCAPIVHTVGLLMQRGAPDATAMSIQTLLMERIGLGVVLLLTGIVWLIVRRDRRTSG